MAVDAAAAQRVRKITRAVCGQHDNRLTGRKNGPKLGNGYLKVRQNFQQKGLKLFIRPVNLVNKQHRSPLLLNRTQQRAFKQKLA